MKVWGRGSSELSSSLGINPWDIQADGVGHKSLDFAPVSSTTNGIRKHDFLRTLINA